MDSYQLPETQFKLPEVQTEFENNEKKAAYVNGTMAVC